MLTIYHNLTKYYLPKIGYTVEITSEDEIKRQIMTQKWFVVVGESKLSKLYNIVIIDPALMKINAFKSIISKIFPGGKSLSEFQINLIRDIPKSFSKSILNLISDREMKIRNIKSIVFKNIPMNHVNSPINIKLIKKDSEDYKNIITKEYIPDASKLRPIPFDDNLVIWLNGQIGDIVTSIRVSSSDHGYSFNIRVIK